MYTENSNVNPVMNSDVKPDVNLDENSNHTSNENFKKPEVPETPEFVFGVVTDCLKLNVRVKPHINARVVTVITALTEVKITDQSDDNFYGVVLDNGMYGFCMKKYIALKN